MTPSPKTLRARLFSSLLTLGVMACGPTPPPRSARRDASRAPRPRVRVGAFLRLARAGRVRLVTRDDQSIGLLARVPRQHRAPGWQRAVDTQGNTFKVAPDGRIVTDGVVHRDRQPASVDNVAYWSAQAIALLAQGRTRRQGLVLAAEILDLPAADASVRAAQTWFCRLFGRIGIVGAVRQRLYGHLVAVSHRQGPGVEVRNHVFPFSVQVPLGWSTLAGPVPSRPPGRSVRSRPARPGPKGLPPRRSRAAPHPRASVPTGPASPRRTALVIAIPEDATQGREAANLVWISQPKPSSQTLDSWARKTLAQIAGEKAGAVLKPLAPPTIPGALSVLSGSFGPVRRGDRSFASIQVFFFTSRAAHHVSLYFARPEAKRYLASLLAQVLGSFHSGGPATPCR